MKSTEPSAARIAANQKNAEKSTGPRSMKGKATSSLNSLKHGAFAKSVVLPSEDPVLFAQFRDELNRYLAPDNPVERFLFEDLIAVGWRLKRICLIETTILVRNSISFSGHHHSAGFSFINDAQGIGCVERLGNYEAKLVKRWFRTFDAFQKLRRGGFPPPARWESDTGGRTSLPITPALVFESALGAPTDSAKAPKDLAGGAVNPAAAPIEFGSENAASANDGCESSTSERRYE